MFKKSEFTTETIQFVIGPGSSNFNATTFIQVALNNKQTEQRFAAWWIGNLFTQQHEIDMREFLEGLLLQPEDWDLKKIYRFLAVLWLLPIHEDHKNIEKGFAYLKQIAEETIALTIHGAYLWNLGGIENRKHASDLLAQASQRGEPLAHLHIAKQKIKERNYPEAKKYLEMSIENPESLYLYGVLYFKGWGVSQNFTEAVIWLKRAAEQGHAEALHLLGNCYLYKQGVSFEDKYMALACHQEAASLGVTNSLFTCGQIYLNQKLYIEAAEYFEKGSKKQCCRSMLTLGLMHFQRQHPISDMQAGYRYIEEASSKGYIPAKLAKGKILLFGNVLLNIKPDFTQIKHCFEEAATEKEACLFLAFMHQYGLGTPVNMIKAFKYYHYTKPLGDMRIKTLVHLAEHFEMMPLYDWRDTNIYVESIVLTDFLTRFPSKDMQSNSDPAFIALLDKMGFYKKPGEFEYHGSWKAIKMGNAHFIWDKFCDYHVQNAKKDSEEFFIWSMMYTNKKLPFFTDLARNFPYLPSREKNANILEETIKDKKPESVEALHKTETVFKKSILFQRFMLFSHRNSESFQTTHPDASILPPELTEQVFENLQDVNRMPW